MGTDLSLLTLLQHVQDRGVNRFTGGVVSEKLGRLGSILSPMLEAMENGKLKKYLSQILSGNSSLWIRNTNFLKKHY